jgi:hypothetical protein
MFVDFRDQFPPPPWQPRPPGRRITRRQERLIGAIVLANMALLLLAPVAGGTIIAGLLAILR